MLSLPTEYCPVQSVFVIRVKDMFYEALCPTLHAFVPQKGLKREQKLCTNMVECILSKCCMPSRAERVFAEHILGQVFPHVSHNLLVFSEGQ